MLCPNNLHISLPSLTLPSLPLSLPTLSYSLPSLSPSPCLCFSLNLSQLATWRRNVLNFYSWICYASLFLCVLLCVGAYVCVLSKFEFDWKACDTAAANRQPCPHSAILCASALVFFSPAFASFWCSLALTTSTTNVSRSASCVLPLGSCASLSGFPAMSSAV